MKEQAEKFTVYYEKNKEFFLCATLSRTLYNTELVFTDFFLSSQHYGKIGGVKKREHWDLILGPRTELPFVLALGLQRRWFIC